MLDVDALSRARNLDSEAVQTTGSESALTQLALEPLYSLIQFTGIDPSGSTGT